MRDLKLGVIVYNSSVCSACGACEIMCSLFHEGIVGPASARANIVRDSLTAKHSHIVCQQCPYPSCYYACPLQDKALCIDEDHGSIYINEVECIGCDSCIDACPFDPPRIKRHAEKKVAFKCDLCRGRKEGPICVEYCSFQALTFITKDLR
jgi:Fe-S-cluster-containing hydrogenase component 2